MLVKSYFSAILVEVLLKNGAHVEMSEMDGENAGYTPLMFAIRFRQAKMAMLLLKHNANPRAKAMDGKDSVQLLCQNYSLSMLGKPSLRLNPLNLWLTRFLDL